MSKISKDTGDRLRALRLAAGLTQEKLAERAELHTTYIGQVERGEKNLTIESLSRICGALEVSLAQFFAPVSDRAAAPTPAEEAYKLLQARPPREQRALLELLRGLLRYKDM